MHKIKFRGKRIDNGEWVYGLPYSFKPFVGIKTDERYILMFNPEWDLEAQFNYLKDPIAFSHLKDSVWKVVPESVGQFINRKVENGKEVYEGDIISNFTKKGKKGILIKMPECYDIEEFRLLTDISEVIGNITENPELMED